MKTYTVSFNSATGLHFSFDVKATSKQEAVFRAGIAFGKSKFADDKISTIRVDERFKKAA